jgi:hypothetical protein
MLPRFEVRAMTFRRQNFFPVFLVGLTLAVSAAVARAQSATDANAPAVSPRSDWEQRVISHPADPSYRVGSQPNAATVDYSLNGSPRPRGVWLPAHPTAATVEVAAPSPESSLVPIPAPTPVPVTMPSAAAGNAPYESPSGEIQFQSSSTARGRATAAVATPNDPAYAAGNRSTAAPNVGPNGEILDDPAGGPEAALGPDGSPCDCDGAPCSLGCGDGYRRAMRNISIFGGVEGLSAVVPGQGAEGGIGFREGLNWGGPVGGTLAGNDWREIGFQVGFAADQINIQSNAAGISGELSEIFVTGGLFHRATSGGLQWGLVFDYAHDTFVLTEDLRQLRFESPG